MSLEVKLVAAVVLLLALAGGVWLIDRHGYDRGVAACQAQQAKADKVVETKHEAVVVAADAGMQKAVDAGAQQQAVTEQKTAETVRTIVKVIHDAPSPPACAVQPDSVRALADATDRANAAADRLQGTRASPAAASSADAAKP